MQNKNVTIDDFDKRKWLKKLEDDWCMSGKTIESCLDLWIDIIKTINSPTRKYAKKKKHLATGSLRRFIFRIQYALSVVLLFLCVIICNKLFSTELVKNGAKCIKERHFSMMKAGIKSFA